MRLLQQIAICAERLGLLGQKHREGEFFQSPSLFVVIITVLHQDRVSAIRSEQGFLVGWKDICRFFQADDLDRGAHLLDSFRKVSHVLILGMQGAL